MKKVTIAITTLCFGVLLFARPTAAIPLIGSGGILDQLYGLDNLQRIDDNLDQIWFPANGTATAVAKFSDSTQTFGYVPDLNGDNVFDESFVPLFTVSADTNGVDLGGPTANIYPGQPPAGDPNWTSLPTQNIDLLDHMVTWYIRGGEGNTAGNYVIAWEETYGGGDRSFNDLVVELGITAIEDENHPANVNFLPALVTTPVPEPATILLLGTGLVSLAGFRKKFKK